MRELLRAEPEQDKYFYLAGWIVMGIAAVVLLAVILSEGRLLQWMPGCAFHRMTGYYCPGCGGTRAVFALLRGQIVRSLFYHPFVLFAVIFGGWFMLTQTLWRITAGRLAIGMHYRKIYLAAALLLIFGNCMIKNLTLVLTGVAWMG